MTEGIDKPFKKKFLTSFGIFPGAGERAAFAENLLASLANFYGFAVDVVRRLRKMPRFARHFYAAAAARERRPLTYLL